MNIWDDKKYPGKPNVKAGDIIVRWNGTELIVLSVINSKKPIYYNIGYNNDEQLHSLIKTNNNTMMVNSYTAIDNKRYYRIMYRQSRIDYFKEHMED